MLRRTVYKGCERLYWEPDNWAGEAALASYEYMGKEYMLEFDGCVDDVIYNQRGESQSRVHDIKELSAAIPLIQDAWDELENGKRVKLQFKPGQSWTARCSRNSSGYRVMVRSGQGQTATLSKSLDNEIQYLTLRTEGAGIIHEIMARPHQKDGLTAYAETVTIF